MVNEWAQSNPIIDRWLQEPTEANEKAMDREIGRIRELNRYPWDARQNLYLEIAAREAEE